MSGCAGGLIARLKCGKTNRRTQIPVGGTSLWGRGAARLCGSDLFCTATGRRKLRLLSFILRVRQKNLPRCGVGVSQLGIVAVGLKAGGCTVFRWFSCGIADAMLLNGLMKALLHARHYAGLLNIPAG
ncbi:hypothetical protein KCP73_15290 [Salmonella enterica subsp. enterica]|nr:hypothetical protein KCP73_15290 [Salmonella enterica subsp. enterica]